MVKISAIVILLIALVCFTLADRGNSGGSSPDAPPGNATTSSNEVESSSSHNESPYNPIPHNNTSSDDYPNGDSSSEHGGNDGSESDDGSKGGDDSSESDDDDSEWRPHGKYFRVRIIVVVSLEDIIALTNKTLDIRHSLADLFNISQRYISVHFRLHGLHDISSELEESSDSEDDGSNTNDDSSDDKSNEVEASSSSSSEEVKPAPKGRANDKFFEIIIDIRVPIENATQHVTNSVTIQNNMNTTLSNPQSGLSRTLAASGAKPQSTATSKVTEVTASNSTSNSSTTSSVIVPNKQTSSGAVVKTTAMMMLAGLASLIL